MNYNSWKRKYPNKSFPNKFGKNYKDLFVIQNLKDAFTTAHQTAISNYGTTVFFGDIYTLSPTTIYYNTDIAPIQNITISYAI